jgi:hypothetical protein
MGRYQELHENESKILSGIRSFIRENKYFISEKDKTSKIKTKGSKVKPSGKNVAKSKSQQKTSGKRTITKKPSDTQKKSEDKVIEQWNLMAKNPVTKTAILETIPLVYALIGGSPNKVTYSQIRKLIISDDYDWNPKAKDWLTGMFDIIDKSDAPSGLRGSFRENIIYGKILSKDGESISDINGGEKISDFIHKSIKGEGTGKKRKNGFYDILTQDSKSKEFTADVVVFWGGGKGVGKKVLDGTIPIDSFVPNETNSTLISEKYGVTMACISLKALHGKIGKIKKFIVNHYTDGSSQMLFSDDEVDESINENNELNENLFSSMKDMVSKFMTTVSNTAVAKKIIGWYNDFKKWSSETYNKITQIISPSSPEVNESQSEFNQLKKEADELLAEFDNQMNEYIKTHGLTEASENTPIPITDCYAKKIESWYSSFDKRMTNYNKKFIEFGTMVQQYQNDDLLRIQFKTLNTSLSSFKEWKDSVKTFVTTELKEAKKHPGDFISSRSKCRELLYSDEKFVKSREEMKPILMSAANFASLDTINGIIKRYSTVSTKENSLGALNNIVKIATEFNAEAIYGGAFDIPLIKYDGTKILRLGSRKSYEDKATDYLVSKIKDMNKKLPVIGIKVYPSDAKGSIIPTWYQVIAYTLAEYIENTEAGVEDTRPIEERLSYNVIMFSCNSGSEFAFSIEGTGRITGTQLLDKLTKDSVDTTGLTVSN